MFVGGGAGFSASISDGAFSMEASCSPVGIFGFIVYLGLYIWSLAGQVATPKRTPPQSMRWRALCLFLDIPVIVCLVTVPMALVALLIESSHTGQFVWNFARTSPSPSDSAIMAAFYVSLVIDLVVYALPVGLQRQSPGSLITNSFTQSKNPSVLRAVGRAMLSIFVLTLGAISIPMAWARKDKRFWHDVAFDTYPIRLTGVARKSTK